MICLVKFLPSLMGHCYFVSYFALPSKAAKGFETLKFPLRLLAVLAVLWNGALWIFFDDAHSCPTHRRRPSHVLPPSTCEWPKNICTFRSVFFCLNTPWKISVLQLHILCYMWLHRSVFPQLNLGRVVLFLTLWAILYVPYSNRIWPTPVVDDTEWELTLSAPFSLSHR